MIWFIERVMKIDLSKVRNRVIVTTLLTLIICSISWAIGSTLAGGM